MNNILTEKEYQHEIMDYLKDNNGYIIRKSNDFDRRFAIDRELLFKFLNDTQSETMDALRKIYKTDFEDTLVNFINTEMTKASGGLISVLKHGIDFQSEAGAYVHQARNHIQQEFACKIRKEHFLCNGRSMGKR